MKMAFFSWLRSVKLKHLYLFESVFTFKPVKLAPAQLNLRLSQISRNHYDDDQFC